MRTALPPLAAMAPGPERRAVEQDRVEPYSDKDHGAPPLPGAAEPMPEPVPDPPGP
jgi:hypothetical protein